MPALRHPVLPIATLLVLAATSANSDVAQTERIMQEFAAKKLKSRFGWTQVMRAMEVERVAEVGVWRGEFTQAVLDEKLESLQEYVLADPWRHLKNWNMPFNVEKERFDKIYASTMQKVHELDLRRVVRVLRGTSLEVQANVTTESLDFVYIDGDHTITGITIDMLAWYRKVRPGGVLAGDDFRAPQYCGNKHQPVGVKPVVTAWAQALGVKLYEMGEYQWGIIKPFQENNPLAA